MIKPWHRYDPLSWRENEERHISGAPSDLGTRPGRGDTPGITDVTLLLNALNGPRIDRDTRDALKAILAYVRHLEVRIAALEESNGGHP